MDGTARPVPGPAAGPVPGPAARPAPGAAARPAPDLPARPAADPPARPAEEVPPDLRTSSGADLPAAVRLAQERLQGVTGRPLEEQVARYDEVHRLLQDALATLDEP